jgi:hypothetical protein
MAKRTFPTLELDTVQSPSGHTLILSVKAPFECALLINLFAMAQITLSAPRTKHGAVTLRHSIELSVKHQSATYRSSYYGTKDTLRT